MEQLYHKTSFKIAKLITRKYSTSFSLGIRVFAPAYREAVYTIYGFVRLADEIVDSFHNHNRHEMLMQFRKDTDYAIHEGISVNPVLNAFQKTVNEYGIDQKYITDFLNSMEMDLYNNYYEKNHYDNYVYGSAEVVGLMCLRVFCRNDDELFDKLVPSARALGSAFQKVNFLRDIKSDLAERGRIYLPGVSSMMRIDDENKLKLEVEIQKEFELALWGIKNLPGGVRLGVYSAYMYYWILFKKIRKLQVKDLMERRVRVSNFTKLALLVKTFFEIKILRIT